MVIVDFARAADDDLARRARNNVGALAAFAACERTDLTRPAGLDPRCLKLEDLAPNGAHGLVFDVAELCRETVRSSARLKVIAGVEHE
jgi:hypothetical protein